MLHLEQIPSYKQSKFLPFLGHLGLSCIFRQHAIRWELSSTLVLPGYYSGATAQESCSATEFTLPRGLAAGTLLKQSPNREAANALDNLSRSCHPTISR